MAKENAGVVDGPYAGRFTAYVMSLTKGKGHIVVLGPQSRCEGGIYDTVSFLLLFLCQDLKKTMAVLLENMLLRINELEHKINNVMNTSMNGSLHNTSSMHEILQPGNQLLAEELISNY
ncbi:hypothetical protein KUTeg_002020 [Tegillarca granosa]|uniref:MGT5A-like N-terminal domain-containing protein n=1 Tax=Tegillarca granosa TaxID=220873 RepID=A0ABQ9FT56_TEGGR|nr:hypothetical protein KUTeg_002020 [Tegillarca granosa]